LEQLGLVQTDTNRAPAEEWIRLARVSTNGQLVAAHIERAYYDGLVPECAHDALIRAELLFLVRHGCATDGEEFGAHKSHTFRTTSGSCGSFVGQVDVRAQYDSHSVQRDRFRGRDLAHRRVIRRIPHGTLGVRRNLRFGGIRNDDAQRAVENYAISRMQLGRGIAQANHRGETQRSRENCYVRGSRTGVGRDRCYRVAIQLHGETGRQIVRYEYRIGALRQIHRIAVRKTEQHRQHADVHIGEVGDALAQHLMRVSREALAPVRHDKIERLLRSEILVNESAHVVQQFDVVEHCELHIEDGSLLLARVSTDAVPDLAETCPRPRDHVFESGDFGTDLLVRDDALPYLWYFPAEKMYGPHDDPWRGRQTHYCAWHLPFPELCRHELGERIYRGIRIGSRGAQNYLRAALGGQHHHSHDALAVHLQIVPYDCNIAGELSGRLDDLGGRSRVDSVLVHDRNRSLRHQRATE